MLYQRWLWGAVLMELKGACFTGPVLLVAIEKRVNFTLREQAPIAHAYEYFRGLFRPSTVCTPSTTCIKHAGLRLQLEGEQIPAHAVHKHHRFERAGAMELWKLQWAA